MKNLSTPGRRRGNENQLGPALRGQEPKALVEIRRVLREVGRPSVAEQLPDPDYAPLGTLRRELALLGLVEERSRGWWTYTSTWTVA